MWYLCLWSQVHVISSNMICIVDLHPVCLPRQVIIYVDDANDEVPVFTQQQYNRLGLRETAGIGTSVIVVRATDPDTGESSCLMSVLAVDSSTSGFTQNRKRYLAECGFKFPASAQVAFLWVSCLQVTNPYTSGCHSIVE